MTFAFPLLPYLLLQIVCEDHPWKYRILQLSPPKGGHRRIVFGPIRTQSVLPVGLIGMRGRRKIHRAGLIVATHSFNQHGFQRIPLNFPCRRPRNLID
jgi:hypothetical protein